MIHRLLVADLLEDYSDALGNRGCNDFDLKRAIPDAKERDAFVRAFHEYNGDPEEYYENTSLTDDYRLPDFAVASFLAHLIRTSNEQ